jgi:hypothetical protein
MRLSRVQMGLMLFALCNLALSALAVSELLALGDGKISSQPQVGYVFSCQQRFNANAPGAFRAGEWIQNGFWQPDKKIQVQGSVAHTSSLSLMLKGEQRLLRANNLPKHTTGVFPVQATDPAYQYDRNPNRIVAQNILLELPATPALASRATCLPMGMIGLALSGVAIYNALDLAGRDAAAYEIQDSCDGHPERSGQYHYHNASRCLTDSAKNSHSDLVGYALDGFGLYGLLGEDGKPLENRNLDECHGHTHSVIWDGKTQNVYHYHMTKTYPYTLGCFRGTLRQ